MNLDQNPTVQELREILRNLDDDAAHHLLWVEIDGTLHIDPVPDDITPGWFAQDFVERTQFRYETFCSGNGYVGIDAADDSAWVERLYNELNHDWQAKRRGYIEGWHF